MKRMMAKKKTILTILAVSIFFMTIGSRGRYGPNTLNSPWYLNGDGTWTGDGATLDMTDGTKFFTLRDNDADAFRIIAGSKDFVTVDSRTDSDFLIFGDSGANVNYTFLGSGQMSIGGTLTIGTTNYLEISPAGVVSLAGTEIGRAHV